MSGVKPERNGWRDEAISRRHRMWGVACPAVDVDFLLIECNYGKPVALIDYKHENGAMPSWMHASTRAIRAMCNDRHQPIPFIVTQYRREPLWQFSMHAYNEAALHIFDQRRWPQRQWIDEFEYVRRLYALRDMEFTAQQWAVLESTQKTQSTIAGEMLFDETSAA